MNAQEILIEEIRHRPEPMVRKILRYLKSFERQRGRKTPMDGLIADTSEKLGPAPEAELFRGQHLLFQHSRRNGSEMRITVNQHCASQGCSRGNQRVHRRSASRCAYPQSNAFAADGFVHIHDFIQQRTVTVHLGGLRRVVNPKLMQPHFKLEQSEDGSSRYDRCILKKRLNASRAWFSQVMSQ